MIVIPMAGLSSRFSKAGYKLPKYMLPLDGKSVFKHSIESFSEYFNNIPFLFIARNVAETPEFIRKETSELGIQDARIVILDHETAGQAETVEIGVKKEKIDGKTPITIFNIDTFRKDFCFPKQQWFAHSDGYLEVFHGEGQNWSYVGEVKNSKEPLVARTTEKDPISSLCCDGLYHFATASSFMTALDKERQSPSMNELYIAPLYNHLIKEGKNIHYNLVEKEKIIFCGTPSEYKEILNK